MKAIPLGDFSYLDFKKIDENDLSSVFPLLFKGCKANEININSTIDIDYMPEF